MAEKYSNAVLTSYATFKELYRSRKYKNPYQILSEFIRFIILSKSLRVFSITEIQRNLYEEFGFNTPLAVIAKAIMSINGLTFNAQGCQADLRRISSNNDFTSYREKTDEESKCLISSLKAFVRSNHTDVIIDEGKLSQALIAFVLDESIDNGYNEIIGEYVLQNENNEKIRTALDSIREGSIIYSGLNYEIVDFDTESYPLTLFLDTEILFHIVGLHGGLYQTLANDFLDLVSAANRRGSEIRLTFFPDVKRDVDDFFTAAEHIVEDNLTPFNDAMRKIIAGCEDKSDVAEKRSEFYRLLQDESAIKVDEKQNYYTIEDTPYNLETEIPGFPSADEANFEGLKFCSHINKLRKGYQTQNYLECRYLVVTDTRKIIEVSNALCDLNKNPSTNDRYCEYAVTLTRITNILWYLMNRGFGSTEYPKNLSVVTKARLILSAYVSQKITDTYKEIKEKHDKEEISDSQAASRILALKEKHTLPEELSAENVRSDLDFSESNINRYEEERAADKRIIDDQNDKIHGLEFQVSSLKDELEDASNRIKESEKQNESLKQWKIELEKNEQNIARKKEKR